MPAMSCARPGGSVEGAFIDTLREKAMHSDDEEARDKFLGIMAVEAARGCAG